MNEPLVGYRQYSWKQEIIIFSYPKVINFQMNKIALKLDIFEFFALLFDHHPSNGLLNKNHRGAGAWGTRIVYNCFGVLRNYKQLILPWME